MFVLIILIFFFKWVKVIVRLMEIVDFFMLFFLFVIVKNVVFELGDNKDLFCFFFCFGVNWVNFFFVNFVKWSLIVVVLSFFINFIILDCNCICFVVLVFMIVILIFICFFFGLIVIFLIVFVFFNVLCKNGFIIFFNVLIICFFVIIISLVFCMKNNVMLIEFIFVYFWNKCVYIFSIIYFLKILLMREV